MATAPQDKRKSGRAPEEGRLASHGGPARQADGLPDHPRFSDAVVPPVVSGQEMSVRSSHVRPSALRDTGFSTPDAMLSERAQHLFRVLVQRYIGSGHPVGSRTLSRDSGLDLSPATVRNVMADLEELGLLCSPHVSAGRIPTVQGYRFFVDSLIKVAPIDGDELERLRSQLENKGERESLMDAATSLVSDVTHMAGVVTLPKQERLIPASRRVPRALAGARAGHPRRQRVRRPESGHPPWAAVFQGSAAAGRQLPERGVRGQGSAGGARVVARGIEGGTVRA